MNLQSTSKITIHHRLPREDIVLGVVYLEGVNAGPAPSALQTELDSWVVRRQRESLTKDEDALRGACRKILRNGGYRATGRGKPASEYLMRTALEEVFPRINGLVDANNLVSLQYCVPISLWDLERAESENFEFRLGRADETYVFNATGQELSLKDLVCGCSLKAEGSTIPIVTPVKDSLATKTTSQTRSVVGCIYYPLPPGNKEHLETVTAEFHKWLLTCGIAVRGTYALCFAQETITLSIPQSSPG